MKKTTKSSEVIRALKSIFARYGILEQVHLTIVLNLTMHNSHTLKKSGDSSILPVVQDFPSQTERLNMELKL